MSAKSLPQTEIAVITMDDRGQVLIGPIKDGVDMDKLSVPISPIQPFESISDAAKRTVVEWSGHEVEPQHAIFVCESIDDKVDDHRIVVFVFAKRTDNTLLPAQNSAFWVDVRNLGEHQERMSAIAADGFYKFSMVLRQQAAKADTLPKQA